MISTINFLTQNILKQIELLAHRNNVVLWTCDETYSQLYYVSSNYLLLWKRDIADIYESLQVWSSYLVNEEKDEVIKNLKNRNTPINPSHTEYYCYQFPDGQKQWCIDRSFHLKSTSDKCLLIAGVAMPISQNQLSGEDGKIISDKVDTIITKYYQLLIQTIDNSLDNYKKSYLEALSLLTKREKETLEMLLKGLSAKQLSRHMNISTRTVEAHIIKIKSKFKVGSKSELITMAIENNCIKVSFP